MIQFSFRVRTSEHSFNSSPRGCVVPENKRRFQRHQRPRVLRNEPRGVVSGWAIGRDNGGVCEATRRTNQAYATIHSVRDWVLVFFLRLRVQFDPHGIRIDIIKKNLNVK